MKSVWNEKEGNFLPMVTEKERIRKKSGKKILK